ncbi:hypothetical protein, partial [Escherichia coli]|uniref:hypothetical protein n=1 Tax=Escherichia coli TaxID=562 RepID=UPI0019157860
ASQLQLAASASQPAPVDDRHAANLDMLRSGRPVVLEEVLSCGAAKYVFLTSHRPVQIAGRNLLISTSTDVTGQVKALASDVERSLSMAGSATAEAVVASAREAQSTLAGASTEAANLVRTLAADMQH